MSKRARAYVDGHNFYHGAMKDSPEYKWLDLAGLCAALLDHKGNLELVRYFTARVVDLGDPSQSQRQDVYLQALAATGVDIVEGQFARRDKRVRLKGSETLVDATVYEEKGTDVNLAADLVYDACQGLDVALVISNDSDLQRAVDLARRAGTVVYVVNPHHRRKRKPDGTRNRRYHAALIGDIGLNLRNNHLLRNQLPSSVPTPDGPKTRPTEWRRRQRARAPHPTAGAPTSHAPPKKCGSWFQYAEACHETSTT
jgi:uncharacterized LabA/DUF88 family protein